MLGNKITDMKRLDTEPPDEWFGTWKKPLNTYFNSWGGGVNFEFEDGFIFGVRSDMELASLACMDDTNVEIDREYFKFIVSVTNPVYSQPKYAALLGKKITGLTIYKEDERYSRREAEPRESGIKIKLEEGTEFYITFGYHDEGESLSILFKDGIAPPVLQRLHVIWEKHIDIECQFEKEFSQKLSSFSVCEQVMAIG
jgi:hypothetical protein